jgi:hypothetical protein
MGDVVAVVAFGLVLRDNAKLTDTPTLVEDDEFFSTTNDGCKATFPFYEPSATLIMGNPELTSLEGLSGRTQLCRGLEIIDNDSLVDLTGLENVATIGAASWPAPLVIDDNEAIVTVAALDPERDGSLSVVGDLEIVGNPSLPTCDAEKLASALMATGWSGQVEIEMNGDLPCQ